MAYHNDLLPTTSNWIHDLARGEIHPDADRILQLGASHDPAQLIEESTIAFLTELKEQFNEFIRTFNSYSEAGQQFQEVRIYNIAQTVADFMLYRNQIKLVISNSAHGVIQIAFAQHTRSSPVGAPMSGDQSFATALQRAPQELSAQMGPFRDVHWTFQGEKVTAHQLAKFYFTEFIRATRESRRSRSSNQLLMEQIKTLLQEKGLDL